MRFLPTDGNWEIASINFSSTALVRDFSSKSIYKPGQAAKLDQMLPNPGTFRMKVFANGIDSESEGYVSLLLESSEHHHYCPQCVVGVMDTTGGERFSRSFSFAFEFPEKQRCLIKKYIKRRTLLEEPLELLPNDCLTVHVHYVHVDMIQYYFSDLDEETGDRLDQTVKESFTTRVFGEEERYCLSLDSEVFGKLKKASSYFQSMFELPMEEQRTRLMKIPDEERSAFKKVCCILMDCPRIYVPSVEKLCDIYVTARKYFLPPVIENCRRLFLSVLRSEQLRNKILHKDDLPLVYQLAETYNDALLEKILDSLNSGNDSSGNETGEDDFKNYLNTEWYDVTYYQGRTIEFRKKPEKKDELKYNFYQ